MRKALLFILLFGGSLAVLFLIIRMGGAPVPVEPTENGEASSGQASDGQAQTRIQLPDGEQIGVILEGSLEWVRRESEGELKRPLYRIRAQDVKLAEIDERGQNLYDLFDILFDFYNTETGSVRMHLEATSSRVPVILIEGAPGLGGEEAVRLSNVEVTLLEGAPIVPLNLRRIPVLEIDATTTNFHSPDFVQLDAPGLEASGTGMDYQAERETLQFLRDTRIEALLNPERDMTATLLSTGTGQVVIGRRPDLGPEVVELLATGGTQLVLSGEEPLTVEAQRISLLGRAVRGEVDSFEAASVDAQGGVSLERGGSFFRADQARLEFSKLGDLELAVLRGSPRGSVAIDSFLDDESLLGVRVQLEGQGPLRLDMGQQVQFEMLGPSTLRIPEKGASVEASEWIRATGRGEDAAARVLAKGDVQARFGERLLESEEIDARIESNLDGVTLFALAKGETHISGGEEAVGDYDFVAARGLQFQLIDERVLIPFAEEVTLSVKGENGLEAQAGELRDFDLEAFTFEAAGGVSYQLDLGSGTALSARADGPDDLELTGVPGAPATFSIERLSEGSVRFEDGLVAARSIRLQPNHLKAAGDVDLRLARRARLFDLACDEVELQLDPEAPGRPRAFELQAAGVSESNLRGQRAELRLEADRLAVKGLLEQQSSDDETAVASASIDASGSIRFKVEGQATIEGTGEFLELNEHGQGRLWTEEGRQVETIGTLPGSDLPYKLNAQWVEFGREGIFAAEPRIRIDRFMLPVSAIPRDSGGPTVLFAQGHSLSANREGLLLSGNARVRGVASSNRQWSLDANFVQLMGLKLGEAEEAGDQQTSEQEADGSGGAIAAWGDVRARVGQELACFGERFDARPGVIRLEGEPARLEAQGMRWEAGWIEYDAQNLNVTSGPGTLQSFDFEQDGEPWSIEYESMQPFERLDTTILVLRKPIFNQAGRQVHANWAAIWLDREEWAKAGSGFMSSDDPKLRVDVVEPPDAPERQVATPNLFGRFQADRVSKFLTEIYVEGNVEAFAEGERTARAGAVYIDLVDGHGWIQDADVSIPIDIGGEETKLHAKAEWLRHSANGTLHADHAVLTACSHDEPHYVILSRKLKIKPSQREGATWDVDIRKNSLRFTNGPSLPFPPIKYASDQEGRPLFDDLAVADTARFGASVQASARREISKVARKALGGVFRIDTDKIEGQERYNISWLGSRGLLLGFGLEGRVGDDFWLNMYVDGVSDSDDDRGLVRVDSDDRDQTRLWYRTRGRLGLGEAEWLDIAFSSQTDAGVQAEFFESDYLRYEERDNYLHWRKAKGEDYYDASVKVRVDNYRTEVEELPSLGFFHGRTPIAHIGKLPLLYTSKIDADYLRRRDGDPEFEETFDDTAGDREVLRFDNQHRLELPVELGFAGLKATPFLAGRATAWDEGFDEDDSPVRTGIFTGIDLATRFWKRRASGSLHELAPVVSVRTDVVADETSGTPVHFDRTEDSTEGTFVDLGLRSRWWASERRGFWDLELRAQHANDVKSDREEGWRPIGVLSSFIFYPGGIPVGLTHDGRYDTDDGDTVYSRSRVGFQPADAVALELGFDRGLDDDRDELYEAASVELLWRAVEKWEFEFKQAFSLRDDDRLNSEVVIRRMGHDFVFETELGTRSGEGGSSISFSIKPVLGYDPSRLRLLDNLARRTRD